MNSLENLILIFMIIVKLNCENNHLTVDFPHHVIITSSKTTKEIKKCCGSIISDKWIVTTMRCTELSSKIRIDFNRKTRDINTKSMFSVVMGLSAVIPYPSQNPEQDDIALLKLPIKLEFSGKSEYHLRPIGLYLDNYEFNVLAVMPVFTNNDNGILHYGKYQKTHDCTGYDVNTEFCVRGWNNGLNLPCNSSQGAGLVLNWGTDYPRLIGLYSHSIECKPGVPFIYTCIKKYVSWIRSVVNNERQL